MNSNNPPSDHLSLLSNLICIQQRRNVLDPTDIINILNITTGKEYQVEHYQSLVSLLNNDLVQREPITKMLRKDKRDGQGRTKPDSSFFSLKAWETNIDALQNCLNGQRKVAKGKRKEPSDTEPNVLPLPRGKRTPISYSIIRKIEAVSTKKPPTLRDLNNKKVFWNKMQPNTRITKKGPYMARQTDTCYYYNIFDIEGNMKTVHLDQLQECTGDESLTTSLLRAGRPIKRFCSN